MLRLRVVRLRRRAPRRFSRSVMRRLTADLETPSFSAAAVKLRVSTTRMKASMSSSRSMADIPHCCAEQNNQVQDWDIIRLSATAYLQRCRGGGSPPAKFKPLKSKPPKFRNGETRHDKGPGTLLQHLWSHRDDG